MYPATCSWDHVAESRKNQIRANDPNDWQGDSHCTGSHRGLPRLKRCARDKPLHLTLSSNSTLLLPSTILQLYPNTKSLTDSKFDSLCTTPKSK